MILYGLTDIGTARRENQDCYGLRLLDEDISVAVVCDGMGGAQAGNVASTVAVNAFLSTVEEMYEEKGPSVDPAHMLHTACRRANQVVYEMAQANEEYQGMGTTLVGAYFFRGEAYLVNVGDSRCYLICDRGIEQLTQDHSLVQLLVNRGELTPEQARCHPRKNLITRALGVDPEVNEDLYRTHLCGGDSLLLCSDGLINVLTDEQILEILRRSPGAQAQCNALLQATLEQGAPDNVTVVLAQMDT